MMRYCVLLQSEKKKKIRKERKNKCEVTYDEELRPPAERKKKKERNKKCEVNCSIASQQYCLLQSSEISVLSFQIYICVFKYIFEISVLFFEISVLFICFGFSPLCSRTQVIKKKKASKCEVSCDEVASFCRAKKKGKKKKKNAR